MYIYVYICVYNAYNRHAANACILLLLSYDDDNDNNVYTIYYYMAIHLHSQRLNVICVYIMCIILECVVLFVVLVALPVAIEGVQVNEILPLFMLKKYVILLLSLL